MALSLMETAIRVGVPCPLLCLGTSFLTVFPDVEGVIRRGVLLSDMGCGVLVIGPAGVAPSIDRPYPGIGGWFLLGRTLPFIGGKFLFGFCVIRGFVNRIFQRRETIDRHFEF